MNDSIKTATSSVAVPKNISNQNPTAGDASTDAARRADFDLFQNQVETIDVSPWDNGTFNGSKQRYTHEYRI